MAPNGTKFALKPGTEVLIVYPLEKGRLARFLPGVVKQPRRYEIEDRVYEPAQLLEGVSLAQALVDAQACPSLATAQFEQTLYAVAEDAMGTKAASRLTVFREQHHLVAVDSQQVLEA